MADAPRVVTKEEFMAACEAVWTEIEYQNNLPRRTSDEATGIPAFMAMLSHYTGKTVADWADQPAVASSEFPTPQVPDAVHGLRKCAAIAIRAMVYCGVLPRVAGIGAVVLDPAQTQGMP